MMRQFATLVSLVVVLSTMQAQQLRPVTNSETTVENYIQEMFFMAHKSGSLTLHGTCKSTLQGSVVVSEDLKNPPQGPFNDISEVIDVLSKNKPELSITHTSDGIMRVSDNRVKGGLLQVHLNLVHIKEAKDPHAAIKAVLAAPEAQGYLKDNRIELGDVFNMPSSRKGVPRLTVDLRELTVGQALDKIINFFPGVWIYSECMDNYHRRVTIRIAEVGPPAQSTGDTH